MINIELDPNGALLNDGLLFLPPPPEPDDDAVRAIIGVIILCSEGVLVIGSLSKGLLLLLSYAPPLSFSCDTFDPVLSSGRRGIEVESRSEDSPSETSELGAIEGSFTPSLWLTA
eukprot:CAMPEP_0119048098 /NCGR_PEP_ID=MMETSP1177-20130426/56907_1 /TAXON_ID=2985 /ORGANISM="Ochromonas sp, Strain CCMP1899" /LENGTH=114 /DNA_ID=CAMNT_0007023527 /DNA_START=188 /DNA_END=532 /DNA_ORIENTATION=-